MTTAGQHVLLAIIGSALILWLAGSAWTSKLPKAGTTFSIAKPK